MDVVVAHMNNETQNKKIISIQDNGNNAFRD
jgi:hypothetical protein